MIPSSAWLLLGWPQSNSSSLNETAYAIARMPKGST